MSYRENYSKVPDFDVLPADTYPIQVEESIIADGKDPKKPKVWTLKLCITNGKYVNRFLWARWSMGDSSTGFRKGTMTALGLDTKRDESYDLIEDVVGRKALAEVVIDDSYDGVPRNKVKRLRTPTHSDAGIPGSSSLSEDNPFVDNPFV